MTERIHPTAIVAAGAQIAEDVTIGPLTIVYDDVIVGSGSVIGSHCVLGEPTPLADGEPLRLGRNSLIRSHSVFYQGSTLGDGLRTGHRVTVRERLVTGIDLQIGTLSDFQGHATIGDHVRTHSNVHIGHLSRIEDFVWIFPYVVLTNDPHPPSDGHHRGVTVERYAVVATMSTIMPGVTIGTRSLVAAQSLVRKDVEPDTVVGGVPAKVLAATSAVMLSDGSGPAYPWMRHFHRGYPSDVVDRWREEYASSQLAD